MSRYDESYEDRRAREREEERSYRGDVLYEVWRAGGNCDRIRDDRVADHYHASDPVEMAARDELRHQRPPPPEQPEQEEFPPEDFAPDMDDQGNEIPVT